MACGLSALERVNRAPRYAASLSINLVNIRLKSLVNGILCCLASRRGSCARSSVFFITLFPGEESIVNLGHVNAVERDLGGGGNHVALVDAAQGNAVAAVRA